MNQEKILKGYEYAKEVYAGYGINVDAAIKAVDSMHRDTVILLGGKDKGYEYYPLFKKLK